MKAVVVKSWADLRRRKLQSVVIALVILLSSTAATLALSLLVESDAPYDHAFAQARAIEQDHVVFSIHADNQLASRGIVRWQIVTLASIVPVTGAVATTVAVIVNAMVGEAVAVTVRVPVRVAEAVTVPVAQGVTVSSSSDCAMAASDVLPWLLPVLAATRGTAKTATTAKAGSVDSTRRDLTEPCAAIGRS